MPAPQAVRCNHDGLHEAMRRLVASGLLPERASQPVKVWANVSLAELRAMDDWLVLTLSRSLFGLVGVVEAPEV
jgi:hypothetical protein